MSTALPSAFSACCIRRTFGHDANAFDTRSRHLCASAGSPPGLKSSAFKAEDDESEDDDGESEEEAPEELEGHFMSCRVSHRKHQDPATHPAQTDRHPTDRGGGPVTGGRASKGEAHFDNLVAQYKSRLVGGDVAAQLSEWM